VGIDMAEKTIADKINVVADKIMEEMTIYFLDKKVWSSNDEDTKQIDAIYKDKLLKQVKEYLNSVINENVISKMSQLPEDDQIDIGKNEFREYAANIIDIFEDYLGDKGIVIENKEKEGNEDEANIYGEEYYNMEDAITSYLFDEFIGDNS
jgi:hypothetical protein